MTTIYVGCALTDVPEDEREAFVAFIVTFKRMLLNSGFEVLEFIGLTGGTEVDVYRHDHKCVENGDLFVAVCDHPSIGLGMEVEYAITIKKPTLAVAREGKRVTRILTGAAEVEDCVTFGQYQDVAHLVSLVITELRRLGLYDAAEAVA